ncbi:SDR family NAD(P)-dependent oxidoreductase [Gaopeijia maritima]|uniref:SDR family NAD(P)-dependent oxidoreductase n=1 Tax=Gaopeijia maritima TaxID=3119007 RepID=A0ABU9E602_9BACT
MTLRDRTAVVTGGSSGIGAECARALAREGAAVVVAGRSLGPLEAVVAEIEASGGRAIAVRCDVSDEEGVSALAEAARDAMGPVDILVNSAGISPSAPLHRTSVAVWNQVMAVNATGVFLCTRAFAGAMAEAGWGRVVNVASVAGLTGGRYIAAYAASKHAVVGFTRSIAEELAPRGVTVNAVCPGFVDTPMTDRSVERIADTTSLDAESAREALLSTSPQHRLITVEECAGAVMYLCGEAARGVTGQTLVIDGGALRA